ncbi:MAG: endonuclease MutS2 [Oscillospiraceae bacterium]|nr:endonuclease MutS2 [Oscillospiraceae bacterium]
MDKNELYEKSLKTLELPAVLDLLAAEAVSAGAKEQCAALRPSGEIFEVRRRLGETSAAKDMMVMKGSPSFTGLKDVRGSLARADIGGMLNTRELLDIAGVLQCARTVGAYGRGEGSRRNDIAFLFSSIVADRPLEEKLTTSITGVDEIADAASRELADIRRKMRVANARVRESLQKIISSPTYAKALQEAIITTRSERYVVPVKAEYKNALPGLIHDISSSGATVFVEPMSVVQANNEIRELKAKEKQEIERILMELSADCAADREDISRDYVALTELDVIFARAKLSYRMDACEPEVSQTLLRLRRARHPLLPRETAVPIDITLGEEYDTMVITGPNTGGKTVTLKTAGLLSVMAMCGLHIPVADGSCVPVFSLVLADIGDEQSIEQSLSTFSSHMTNIVRILEHAGEGTLLLFDELGAGTDPTEGAALAIAVIESARRRGAMIAATTHYAELKVYATTQTGVQNASCEFDVETLKPTYRLLVGVPGKSNAFAIALRLGLPEEIIDDARSRVGTESADMEQVIEQLEKQRQEMEREKSEISKKLRQAEENAKKSAQLKAELTVRLEKAELKAKREAQSILDDARRQAEHVFDELDRIRKLESSEPDHRLVNEARAELRRDMNRADEAMAALTEPPREERTSARPARVGDTVEIKSMGVRATVTEENADGTLTLRAGIMNVTASQDEVLLVADAKQETRRSAEKTGAALRTASVASELDIRGMMTDEAIPVMERYLDAAMLAKVKTVTIIHGKGTGALRAAVHESLKRNKTVKSYRLGRFGEGETGVTIVEFK